MISPGKQDGAVRQWIAVPFFFYGLIAVVFAIITMTLPTTASADSPDDVLLEIDRATQVARIARATEADGSATFEDALEGAAALRAQYRISHDPRLLGQALTLLQTWIDQENNSIELAILRADLLQAGHRFDSAQRVLQQAAGQYPSEPRVWNVLAAIYLARGDHDGARDACARLVMQARPLIATGCVAQVAGMTGSLDRAYLTLDRTLNRETGESTPVRAWATAILADLAWRRGQVDTADRHFADALLLAPQDLTYRNEYAMFLALTDQANKAIELTQDHASLALPRAIALRSLNLDVSTETVQLQLLFDAAARRGDNGHAREQAWFELLVTGDTHQALKLARQNWSQQREAIDLLLLARAAFASGRADALSEVRSLLSATTTGDLRIATWLEFRS